MGFISSCWKPFEECFTSSSDVADAQQDDLLWHKDFTHSIAGDFSAAIVQANDPVEDHSQVRVGPFGTLIGVYDGHGGPEASRFISDRLFKKIETIAQRNGGMSCKVLKEAFKAMEEEFMVLVERTRLFKPEMASVGSCCLAGVVYGNILHVVNVGDSRVVLGTVKQGRVSAVRMSEEHNVGIPKVREELKAQHPDDSHIVVLKHGVWRVKGIIQVSRSIGDLYLKKPDFGTDSQLSHPAVPLSSGRPVLSSEPALRERVLTQEDHFLIFASDGLWEHITDQEAVDLVQSSSRNGIAEKLVKTALHRAAKKREMRYVDLRRIGPGVRRYFHDDISVIVVYLDLMSLGIIKASPRQRGRTMDAPVDIFSSHRL